MHAVSTGGVLGQSGGNLPGCSFVSPQSGNATVDSDSAGHLVKDSLGPGARSVVSMIVDNPGESCCAFFLFLLFYLVIVMFFRSGLTSCR